MIVVPIFSPNTIAAAISKVITSLNSKVNVKAIAAEEDWTITVINVPILTNSKVDNIPYPVKEARKFKNSGFEFKSGTEFFNASSPRNNKAKPISTSEKYLVVLLLANIIGKPIAIIGNANAEIFILKPKKN